jgi:hypothetical protein
MRACPYARTVWQDSPPFVSVWTGKGNMGRVKQIKALSSIYLFVLTHVLVVAELVGLSLFTCHGFYWIPITRAR